MIKELPLAFGILVILIAGFLVFILDKAMAKPVVSYGEIQEKHFDRRKGKFLLEVKDWAGKKISIECEPHDFNKLEPADGIQYYCYKGFSGMVHDHKILQKI